MRTTPHNLKSLAALLAALLFGMSTVHAADLSQTIHQAARDAIAYCKQNDIESVGALKFLIVRDDQFADDVGTINMLLARRLEIALVLANDPRKPLKLVEDASATANKIEGASHLSKAGREKLFSVEYHAMWGDQELVPDALIAGVGTVSDDLKTLKFSLLVARRVGNALEQMGKADYVATTTPAVLTEVGESFATRGAFDGGKIVKNSDSSDLPDDGLPGGSEPDAATKTLLTSAKKIKSGTTHPFNDPTAAVRLTVLYDGQPVPFDVRNGRALLREPNEGQRVELRISKDETSQRYGVVVKVNGQNTLKKQQLPDASCGKWILSEPNQTFAIRGYQMDESELEEFRVLSSAESKEREVDYGAEVGTLSVTVFAEGEPAPLELDEDARESKIVETARLPKEPSASFGALKAKLLADANRGLIAEGNRVQGAVRVVKFHANPTPVMSATATYYQP